jgi:hypothetical protein
VGRAPGGNWMNLYATDTSEILSAFPYERLKRRLRNPRFSAGGFDSFTLSSS